MICRTYEVILGARSFTVVAKDWPDALEKALRYDPLRGMSKQHKATGRYVEIRDAMDMIVESDWPTAGLEQP